MSGFLTADLMLRAYAMGVFPMADSAESDEIYWVNPEMRGVIPLDRFHISRSLRHRILRRDYAVRLNSDFDQVVQACGARDETWINPDLARVYGDLHRQGHAHSLEIWQGDQIIGGIFGITLGGAYFGESMFSNARDGSKIALAFLVDQLRRGGFTLFDTQFITPHLASLGGVEIARAQYQDHLHAALKTQADITAPEIARPYDVIQRNTQTS